jgi:tetratricopeptide (TPR) repeat protein
MPKVPEDTEILAQVQARIQDKTIEKKDDYIKAIGERIDQLNDENKDNDANALVYIAVFYNNLGEKEVALDYYTRALAKDPAHRMGLDNLAHLYEDLSRWDRAEETYATLLEAYPDYVPGYRSLAYVYQYHGSDAEAKILKLFEKGLNATNNNADLLTWLIQYYQESGRGEKAVPFSKALADQLNAKNKPGAPNQEDSGIKVEVK